MDTLRHVALYAGNRRYTLWTYDTGIFQPGPQWYIGYSFKGPTGETVFTGEDFGCSPLHAIDSDECLRALLGFLTLKPGDTDREYFDTYTPEQMAFAQGDAEYLSLYAEDDGPAFTDLEEEANG